MNNLAVRAPEKIKEFDELEIQLSSRQAEISNVLPQGVDYETFKATTLIAVKQNPQLLKADRRSLHNAISQAAEDGLKPNGKEAVLNCYYNKREGAHIVQYLPMVAGIRKRLQETSGIQIDSQCVYSEDELIVEFGDNPRLIHRPAGLGKDRGELVGAYAVFKKGAEIIHREVMDVEEINKAKNASKAANGPWKTWYNEMARKTVVHRGAKSVAVIDDSVRSLVNRINDPVHINSQPETTLIEVPSAPAPEEVTEFEIIEEDETEEVEEAEPVSESPDSIVETYKNAVLAAESLSALDAVWDLFEPKLGPDSPLKSDLVDFWEQRRMELGG
jgi:recombination protein RecT